MTNTTSMADEYDIDNEDEVRNDRPDDIHLTLVQYLGHPKVHRYTFMALLATTIAIANVDSLRTAWRTFCHGFGYLSI